MATGQAAGERRDRARDVSALVGTDPTAGDVFVSAYTGRGDALGALDALLRGDAADPDRLASLERHRRSAFGRPASPADEAAAADALVALSLEAESAEADSDALDRAITVVLARDAERRAAEQAATEITAAVPAEEGRPDGAAESAARGAASPGAWPSLRPALALAVIVAAIALGAVGERLVSGALAGPEPSGPEPTPITYFRDPVALESGTETEAGVGGPGDIAAADRWFEAEQSTQDAYPAPFDNIDPESTRLVHTGTDGWRAWVGRETSSAYCLLAHSQLEGTGWRSCIDRAGFAAGGVTLDTDSNTVNWNGRELTVLISRG